MDYAIKINCIYKKFLIEKHYKTLFRAVKQKMRSRLLDPGTFFALNNVNIEVLKGEKIGLIGDNGSGKTTLLKVIAGLYKQEKGFVKAEGKMIFLGSYGIGMEDELSVKENIYLYGAIYGLDRNKIKASIDEIIEFAELNKFINAKVKNLSSGMKQRLAFSVVSHVETDVLLLDEALSVGDIKFREKCLKVFDRYKNSDKTILIATHDMEFVKAFCTKVLWLECGKQVAFGETEPILRQYIGSKIRLR